MKHKTLGNLLVVIGSCMILCSGLLVGYNVLDSGRAEESVAHTMAELQTVLPDVIVPAENFSPEKIAQISQTDPTMDIPYFVVNPKIEMLEQNINGIPYVGVLEIPALNLELPIVSQWSQSNARIAPCRYKGSVYMNDMIICAHNYQSHFGNLPSLSIGDAIRFTDMEGNMFRYRVLEIEVMDGTAVEQMESGDWDMTLFTCTIGGKSRFTVRCQRADL